MVAFWVTGFKTSRQFLFLVPEGLRLFVVNLQNDGQVRVLHVLWLVFNGVYFMKPSCCILYVFVSICSRGVSQLCVKIAKSSNSFFIHSVPCTSMLVSNAAMATWKRRAQVSNKRMWFVTILLTSRYSMNLEHLVKRGHPDARCNLFFFAIIQTQKGMMPRHLDSVFLNCCI